MRSLRLFLLLLPVALTGSVAMAAEPPPSFIGAWGSEGASFGELRCPTGLAFDSEGHVVVADSENGRIQLFQTNGTPVELLRRAGSGDIRLLHPEDVSVDGAGRMLVTDAEGSCVWVFDRGGQLLGDWGGPGTAPGQFLAPGSISANSAGHVFVADWGNGRIQRLDGNGTCHFEWLPDVAGTFSVACDGLGHVFVLDTEGDRVLKYDCSGNLLLSWGERGRGPGEFLRPQGLACDSRGMVYVADTDNYRIQKFDGYGGLLTRWGSFGQADGQFVRPVAIAVNDEGLVAIADEAIHRVQLFGEPPLVKALIDILPGVCPNVLESGGSMQVALLGTAAFDVLQVDLATVRFATLTPTLYGIGDVSQPAADLLDPCACPAAGGDSMDDMVFTFHTGAVRAATGGLAPATVELTGALRDGTPFTARGCLEVGDFVQAGTAQSARVAVRVATRTPAGFDIGFTLGEDARAKLTVIDVGGRVVGRLLNDWRTRGDHRIAWNPGDLQSGVYFIRLEAGDQVIVRRFPLTR